MNEPAASVWTDASLASAELERPLWGALNVTPVIRREGIEWTGGVGGSPLELRLTLENPGPTPTTPQPASVRIAPFGAFLPWRSLTTVAVPAIPPRDRVVVTTTAAPPRRGERTLRQRYVARLRQLLARQPLGPWIPGENQRNRDGPMHPVHLAANIDVRVGHRHPVERHMGRFACLRPGHLNLAYFKVGDGRPDTYTVSVPEHPSAWEVEVAMPGVTGSGYELRDGISAEMTCDAVRSVIAAHGDAEAGRVAFGIARASTGQRTTVEFELERARE